MTKKQKKRPARILKGVRFDPATLAAIEAYCSRASRLVGFRVQFSEAVRVLVVAGLAVDATR